MAGGGRGEGCSQRVGVGGVHEQNIQHLMHPMQIANAGTPIHELCCA